PTIVYFGTVLLLSAILCAPWSGMVAVALLIAGCGAAAVAYSGLVARRAVNQTVYQMVLEDWIWHIVLPLTANAMLLGGGLGLLWHPAGSLFAIAVAAMLLLFIGIHNAWDTVTYMVIQQAEARQADKKADKQREPPPG
ncbi:MAG: hypothetical protein JOZ15_06100, partial [Acidobacteria bacterium]|nr:hypothetical protein [Acidobacteriota bacterium]